MTTSYEFIPQLDYTFYQYWLNRGTITIHNLPISTIETPENIPDNSFIELLFNDTFSYNTYEINFVEVTPSRFTKKIRERLLYSSSLIKCYISNTIYPPEITSLVDVFSIQPDDIIMLDKLLNYRKGNTIILSDVDYNILSTNLSKLIFVYLNLIINKDFSLINEDAVLSSDNSQIETLYEIYVINEYHKIMQEWSFMIDSKLVQLRPIRDRFEIKSLLTDILPTDSTSDIDYILEEENKSDIPVIEYTKQLNKIYKDEPNIFDYTKYDDKIVHIKSELNILPYDSTSTIIDIYAEKLKLTGTPYESNRIIVYLNDKILDKTMYNYEEDITGCYISWESTELELKDTDVFIIDYLTKVVSTDQGTDPMDIRLRDQLSQLDWATNLSGKML